MLAEKIETKHTLFDSPEEMLAPETLSKLLTRPVTRVDCQPMEDHGGVAGGKLSYIDTDAGRLVLKQMSPEFDWIMYYTDDQHCRSVALWQYGLLDELRPEIEHKIIACLHASTGWGILMHDLSDGLFDGWDNSILRKLVPMFIDRMARIHATFWNDPHLEDPRLGLCDSATRLSALALAPNHTGNQRGPIPGWIRAGWKIMETVLDRDVFLHLSRLRDNPQPLLDSMDHYPKTLVHGDYRAPNLAYLKPDQPVIFDWQNSARALMTLDLAMFTEEDYVKDTMGKTQARFYYRECLERYLEVQFSDRDWQAMVELGDLHHALLITCFPAFFSKHADDPKFRASGEKILDQTNQLVRDGMRWL